MTNIHRQIFELSDLLRPGINPFFITSLFSQQLIFLKLTSCPLYSTVKVSLQGMK